MPKSFPLKPATAYLNSSGFAAKQRIPIPFCPGTEVKPEVRAKARRDYGSLSRSGDGCENFQTNLLNHLMTKTVIESIS